LGDILVGVLVDACGWAALIDADLNIDSVMTDILGEFEFKVIESVNDELQRVPLKRRKLSLKLLEIKCEIIPDIENMNYTDDMLLNISLENSWPVLTVDKELKERLIKSGGSYIEVTSSRNLRIIGLRKGE
jgi:rRNA-processing protein FCF1